MRERCVDNQVLLRHPPSALQSNQPQFIPPSVQHSHQQQHVGMYQNTNGFYPRTSTSSSNIVGIDTRHHPPKSYVNSCVNTSNNNGYLLYHGNEGCCPTTFNGPLPNDVDYLSSSVPNTPGYYYPQSSGKHFPVGNPVYPDQLPRNMPVNSTHLVNNTLYSQSVQQRTPLMNPPSEVSGVICRNSRVSPSKTELQLKRASWSAFPAHIQQGQLGYDWRSPLFAAGLSKSIENLEKNKSLSTENLKKSKKKFGFGSIKFTPSFLRGSATSIKDMFSNKSSSKTNLHNASNFEDADHLFTYQQQVGEGGRRHSFGNFKHFGMISAAGRSISEDQSGECTSGSNDAPPLVGQCGQCGCDHSLHSTLGCRRVRGSNLSSAPGGGIYGRLWGVEGDASGSGSGGSGGSCRNSGVFTVLEEDEGEEHQSANVSNAVSSSNVNGSPSSIRIVYAHPKCSAYPRSREQLNQELKLNSSPSNTSRDIINSSWNASPSARGRSNSVAIGARDIARNVLPGVHNQHHREVKELESSLDYARRCFRQDEANQGRFPCNENFGKENVLPDLDKQERMKKSSSLGQNFKFMSTKALFSEFKNKKKGPGKRAIKFLAKKSKSKADLKGKPTTNIPISKSASTSNFPAGEEESNDSSDAESVTSFLGFIRQRSMRGGNSSSSAADFIRTPNKSSNKFGRSSLRSSSKSASIKSFSSESTHSPSCKRDSSFSYLAFNQRKVGNKLTSSTRSTQSAPAYCQDCKCHECSTVHQSFECPDCAIHCPSENQPPHAIKHIPRLSDHKEEEGECTMPNNSNLYLPDNKVVPLSRQRNPALDLRVFGDQNNSRFRQPKEEHHCTSELALQFNSSVGANSLAKMRPIHTHPPMSAQAYHPSTSQVANIALPPTSLPSSQSSSRLPPSSLRISVPPTPTSPSPSIATYASPSLLTSLAQPPVIPDVNSDYASPVDKSVSFSAELESPMYMNPVGFQESNVEARDASGSLTSSSSGSTSRNRSNSTVFSYLDVCEEKPGFSSPKPSSNHPSLKSQHSGCSTISNSGFIATSPSDHMNKDFCDLSAGRPTSSQSACCRSEFKKPSSDHLASSCQSILEPEDQISSTASRKKRSAKLKSSLIKSYSKSAVASSNVFEESSEPPSDPCYENFTGAAQLSNASKDQTDLPNYENFAYNRSLPKSQRSMLPNYENYTPKLFENPEYGKKDHHTLELESESTAESSKKVNCRQVEERHLYTFFPVPHSYCHNEEIFDESFSYNGPRCDVPSKQPKMPCKAVKSRSKNKGEPFEKKLEEDLENLRLDNRKSAGELSDDQDFRGQVRLI